MALNLLIPVLSSVEFRINNNASYKKQTFFPLGKGASCSQRWFFRRESDR